MNEELKCHTGPKNRQIFHFSHKLIYNLFSHGEGWQYIVLEVYTSAFHLANIMLNSVLLCTQDKEYTIIVTEIGYPISDFRVHGISRKMG